MRKNRITLSNLVGLVFEDDWLIDILVKLVDFGALQGNPADCSLFKNDRTFRTRIELRSKDLQRILE